MKQFACVFAVVSLALTGCGGSLCDDLADNDKAFFDKTKSCPSLNEGGTYQEPTDAEVEACEESVKACTDDDKKAINKFIDCVNDLPECTAATEQTFTNSFAGCAIGNLANVSDACLESTEESIRNAARMSISR